MIQSESYGVFEYTHQWPEFYKRRKKRIKVLKNSNKENIISRKGLAIYTD